jgi:RsiW-degrading membrane proteinase PrsW (M82 family)
MELLTIPLLSLLPCVLWLWYFASRNRHKRPPRNLLARIFLFGALATVPAFGLNLLGQGLTGRIFGTGEFTHLLVLLLVVGPVEETVKFLVVYGYALRKKEFNEPLDGVVYSATAALGFAAAENLIYLSQHDPTLVLLRGPLSNPGHALFSALWGLSLSQAKAAPNLLRIRLPIYVRGLLAAALVHSLFDILLVAASRLSPYFFVVLVVAMIGLFIFVQSRIRYHVKNSPNGEGTMVMPTSRYCQECGARGIAGAPCPKCGVLIPEPEELQLCPICSMWQRPMAKFCTRCGANMKLPAKENLDTRPHLSTVSSEGEERIAYILNQSEIHVGRTLDNQFVITHPSVSKNHAIIVNKAGQGGEYIVSDLESSNGTFIEGKRVTVATLFDGCEVRFGRVAYIYRAPRQ